MHGARRIAIEHIHSMAWKGLRVLDLGAGDGEISADLRSLGADVHSVDLDPSKGAKTEDVTDTPWYFREGQYDAVVACYSLQHMLGDEAAVWCEIRRSLKPGGILVMVGRYKEDAPSFEMERGDPLRQDNESSLITMAQASGLRLSQIKTYHYSGDSVVVSSRQNANAFSAVFKRAGALGLPWSEACARYKLMDIEGWMSDVELRYLYETAKAMGGGTAVEIGSFMGRSTCAILAGFAEGRGGRLVVVDTFTGQGGSREAEVKANGGSDWVKGKFLANIKARGLPMPFIYQGDSREVFGRFRKESVDWIFIDGNHTYDGLYEDLRCWVQNVKRDGLVSGHDYHETWPDVIRAVTDYFANGNVASRFGRPTFIEAEPGTSIWRGRR